MLYQTVLDYPMASGSITDENIKILCCLLWIFETRIAIMIMTNQHKHRNYEEDITMFDIIEIIAQLYFEPFIIVYANQWHSQTWAY